MLIKMLAIISDILKHTSVFFFQDSVNFRFYSSKLLRFYNNSSLMCVYSLKVELFGNRLLRIGNYEPSFVFILQRDSVLWHSLQVVKPVPSVFIYLV